MKSVDLLDGIAEVLRRRAALSKTKQSTESAQISTAKSVKSELTSIHGLSKQELQAKIDATIKLIDQYDPDKQKKIVRIFVENVLLWKFGDDLLNDMQLNNLIEEIGDLIGLEIVDLYKNH